MTKTITQPEEKINHILGQLEGVRPSGRGYIAKCPAHDDRYPSLSITQGDDGRVLLFCHAGCSVNQVCGAIGLTVAQLFPDRKTPEQKEQYRVMARRRNTEREFRELRHRAFRAMAEFKHLTEALRREYTLDNMPDCLVKALHILPVIEWHLEILSGPTSEEQLELLREGVLTKWQYNSPNAIKN